MTVQRLSSVDGFVVFDLDDAPTSVGITRSAPKVLVDGATWLARSQTYSFASFDLQVGGASAGVNATPDARAGALAAYVAEVQPWVEQRRFLTSPGKGVAPDDLAALRSVDPRGTEAEAAAAGWSALGVVVATERALGGLSGRTVAVEQLDATGARLVGAILERGGRVTAVGTGPGTATVPEGLDATAFAAGWAEHGADLPAAAGWETGPAAALLAAPVDALVVGSKAGVVDHDVAAGVQAKVVVPAGPIPITAKALAALGRAGVVVLPDFVTTAGPVLATFPLGSPPAPEAIEDRITTAIAGVVDEVLGHPAGPVLAACQRAEAFLLTWRDSLPFGRPLA